jgi:hypothetical protein
MFAAILGSLVMGTLASKVGENIVGKRLGMSEKDRKLLGTVFGMAGGAYGGYAGSAGFGSSGIGATGASGSAGGMGGQSPKVGGDYGTAVEVFNQPTGYNAHASGVHGMDMYSNASSSINPHSGFNEFTGGYDVDLMGGQGYASQYDQMAGMPAESYGMDSFRINEYDQMAGMPARSYGMDMYAARPGNEMFSIGRPDNTWVNPNSTNYMDSSAFLDSRPTPLYQGPSGGNVSAQTYALDSPSRTIDLASSGTPLEVMDASAYTPTPEPFYGVDPNSPTASGSNLGMESVYNSGGNPDIELVPSTGDGYLISPDDQVRLIDANPDGTFTERFANTDLSTSQGVEEFINMDQISADEMPGGPLDPFGTGPNITSANSRVPSNIGDNAGEVPYIVNTPPMVDINVNPNATVVRGDNWAAEAEKVARLKYLEASGPRLEDLDVATLNTPTARLESFDNAVFDSTTFATGRAPMTEEAIARAQEVMSETRQAQLDTRAIERETQSIADAINYEIPPAEKAGWLSKIPKAVKEWATMTGVSLLDMWIKQSLFGQSYDDQIAEGGGGGGGVLRGSSPVVSPYSGGGSGGGGKGVLFSMGGSGQQGRGTHIMALQ